MIDIIPKQITFIFKDEKGHAIPKLLVSCIIIAKTKNNYSIERLISDEKGEIVITKELIENTIDREINNFLMDYNCRLYNCTHLKIVIETVEELKRKQIILSKFYPEKALSLEKTITDSCNKNIHFDRLFPFPINEEEIIIELENFITAFPSPNHETP